MQLSVNLFVYGTLLFPQILEKICGRTFAAAGATLPGYACVRLKDRPYPGLFAAPDSSTSGLVYTGVDTASLRLLDLYEGPAYRRLTVTVTGDDGRGFAAETYAIAADHGHLLTGLPWSREQFVRLHLHDYLRSL
ncbi:MAG: gamma-glutamylcyclotransferase family protein [Thermodesulfobacteriota bacterium]